MEGKEAAETDDLDDSFFDPIEATSKPLSDPSFDDGLEYSDFTDASFMVLCFGDFTEEAFVKLDFEDLAELEGAGAGIITTGEALLDDFLLVLLLVTSLGGDGIPTAGESLLDDFLLVLLLVTSLEGADSCLSTPDSEYLTEDLAFSD